MELIKDKCSNCVLSWKPKGVFNSKFKPLHTAFPHSITISEYRFGIKFNKENKTIN